jgi:glutamate racemase
MADSRTAPIGMFDSGFGGLTVARAVIDVLPHEDLVYIGDTARYPYGPKPADEVRKYAHELAWSLVNDFGVKAVVIACNTAASVAYHELAAQLPVPVVSVIEPGAHALAKTTRNKKVGVIGTVGTIASGSYQSALREADASLDLIATACPGFVEFVERGQTSGDEVVLLAERLLAPVIESGVDALLLGCTHYPYLSRVISEVMGPQVTLVSSGDETAFALAELLRNENLLTDKNDNGEHRFLSSGDVQWFADMGRRLLGPELLHAQQWSRSDK